MCTYRLHSQHPVPCTNTPHLLIRGLEILSHTGNCMVSFKSPNTPLAFTFELSLCWTWHKAKRLTKCFFFKLCVALYRKIFMMPSCLVWSFPPTSFPATVLPHSSLWFSCGIGLGLNCWSGVSVYISESLPTFSRSVISSPTLRASRCESGINNS